MCTVQNYTAQTSCATDLNKQIKLPINVCQHLGGISDLELIYYSLENSKQSTLYRIECTGQDAEERTESLYDIGRYQEIQNQLFDQLSEYASSISRTSLKAR